MKNLALIFILTGYIFNSYTQVFDASGWCQDDNNVNCSNWPPGLHNN